MPDPATDDALDPDDPLDSTEEIGGQRSWRDRLSRRGELLLAAFPVVTILVVLGTVEAVSDQHVLFGSLAGSAFLIYLDPEHPTNSARTLTLAHAAAALAGFVTHETLGAGVASMSVALVVTVAVMIAADAVHPPAAGTALAFALRDSFSSALGLFALAVGMVALLVVVEVVLLRVFRRLVRSGRFRADDAGTRPTPPASGANPAEGQPR